jgi:MFS family permease
VKTATDQSIRTIFALNFSWAFIVIQGLTLVIFSHYGLNLEQSLSVLGVFSITLALGEIPGGLIADLWGKRRALILAGFLKGAGGTALIFFHSFEGFMLAYFLIGLGNCLFSGTDISLLMEKFKDLDSSARLKALGSRNTALAVGTALSSILGGLAAMAGVQTALILNALFAWTSFLLCLLVPASSFGSLQQRARPKFSSLRSLRAGALRFCFSLALLSLLSTSLIWVMQAHWKSLSLSLLWLGALWAVYNLMSGASSKRIAALCARLSPERLQVLSLFVLGGTLLLAASKNSVLAVAGPLLSAACFPAISIPLRERYNRLLAAELRTTMNSLDSFLARGAFFLVAPSLGKLLDQHGSQGLYQPLALGLILLAFALIVFNFLQKSSHEGPRVGGLSH